MDALRTRDDRFADLTDHAFEPCYAEAAGERGGARHCGPRVDGALTARRGRRRALRRRSESAKMPT